MHKTHFSEQRKRRMDSTCATPFLLSFPFLSSISIIEISVQNSSLSSLVGWKYDVFFIKKRWKIMQMNHSCICCFVIIWLWETKNNPFKNLHTFSNYEQDSHTIWNIDKIKTVCLTGNVRCNLNEIHLFRGYIKFIASLMKHSSLWNQKRFEFGKMNVSAKNTIFIRL